MRTRVGIKRGWFGAWVLAAGLSTMASGTAAAGGPHRYLYVAEPGIRDYLEYGGHGLLVFDIDAGHAFVRRIKSKGLNPTTGKPENVKGVCANARTRRLYVSTIRTLTCLSLEDDAILWEHAYDGGCDRMALAPDGSNLYVPSLEGDHWNVVDAHDGHVITKVSPHSGSHNTVYGLDGRRVYLAGLRSPLLTIAATEGHTVDRTVGPFSAPVRPFTINGRQTLAFVNVNGLLGFEVGDIPTGKMLHRVEVQGFQQGPIKRHGCPSHGIGLTPDEGEIWLCDAANQRLHLFDATQMPPRQVASIQLRDEPGWVTFTTDGRFAYPSTGEVIDPKTREILTQLKDEAGQPIQSEKMVEIGFDPDGHPTYTGDQFGLGRVTASP